jgi:hypothetical protein
MIPNQLRSVAKSIVQRSDVKLVYQFSLTDRILVAIFLTLNMMLMLFVYSEHLTPAEINELQQPIIFGGGVFDVISWMLILFIVMPLIRVLETWIGRLVWMAFTSVTGRRGGREVEP